MNKKEPTINSYILGFVLSFGLTIAAFYPVIEHVNSGHLLFSHELLIPFVLTLAVIQLLVQFVFFLHIANLSKSSLNLVALVSTASIIIIIVIGSIWIMNHLNYNMRPKDTYKYIIQEEGLH